VVFDLGDDVVREGVAKDAFDGEGLAGR